MPDAAVLEKLLNDVQAGVRPMGLCVNLDCPAIVELAPRMGFSWILINQDHTPIRGPRLWDMIRAADATRLPHLVQLGHLDPTAICEALDIGSYGVLTPGVETAAEVEQIFEAIRYPPRGKRAFCSVGPMTDYSAEKYSGIPRTKDVIHFGNEHALIIPTIATAAAVDNLDELMAIEDCKIWRLSFANLNLSFGVDPEENPGRAARLFVEIAQQIHAAGRMVSTMMMPIEGQTKDLAEGLEIMGNDLPYAIDAACLAFGMAEMRKISETHRALHREAKS